MKRCLGCPHDFPLEVYGVKQRWPDGTVRSRQARCPICLAEQKYDQLRRRREQVATGAPVDAETQVRLPIGPWRDWIETEISRLGAWIEHGLDAAAFLAIRMDIDPRRLYGWRYATARIDLDHVDAACCAMGETGLLRELYPELWVFGGEALAA